MGRVLPLLVVLSIPGLIGYAIGRLRAPKDYRIVAIREHARLLRKARRMSLLHQEGAANIMAEGAARVFATIDDPPELERPR